MKRNKISIPTAIRFRMFRRKTFRNVSQIGFGAGGRNAILESRQHKQVMPAALVHLEGVTQRRPQVNLYCTCFAMECNRRREIEIRGHNTNDGGVLSAECNALADDCGI